MFEPVYSSQGGAPKGYVCRVLVRNAKGVERFCNKPTKTLWGMRKHGLCKHGMKLQMEMFDAEKVKQHSNAELESLRVERAAKRTSEDGSNEALDLFAAAREEDRRS